MKKIITFIVAITMCVGFSSCGEPKESEEAKEVQAKIDSLPENYSDDIEEALNDVRSLYEALNDEDKETVDKSRIDNLEISRIQNIVDSLPDDYSADSEENCKEVISVLNELDDSFKESLNMEKLDNFNSQRTEKINSLLSSINSSKKDADSIKKSYDSLNELLTISQAIPETYLVDVDFNEISGEINGLKNTIRKIIGEIGAYTVTSEKLTSYALAVTDITKEEPYYVMQYCINFKEFINDCPSKTYTSNAISAVDDLFHAASSHKLDTYFSWMDIYNAIVDLMTDNQEYFSSYTNINIDNIYESLDTMKKDFDSISEKASETDTEDSEEITEKITECNHSTHKGKCESCGEYILDKAYMFGAGLSKNIDEDFFWFSSVPSKYTLSSTDTTNTGFDAYFSMPDYKRIESCEDLGWDICVSYDNNECSRGKGYIVNYVPENQDDLDNLYNAISNEYKERLATDKRLGVSWEYDNTKNIWTLKTDNINDKIMIAKANNGVSVLVSY